MTGRVVFLDTETTGLADDCDVWEIGLITRDPAPDDVDSPEGAVHVDTEYSWLIRPDLSTAEPTGLRIGRYYQRIGDPLSGYSPGWGQLTTPGSPFQKDRVIVEARHIAGRVARLLDGANIVGAVPDFDDRHLRRFLGQHNQAGTWHYHLIDVETLAAGALRMAPPWGLDTLLAAYGLTYDEADRHTALGDARMVRDLYDAVMNDTVIDGGIADAVKAGRARTILTTPAAFDPTWTRLPWEYVTEPDPTSDRSE